MKLLTTKQAKKLDRLNKANKFIQKIADCGRRFFYHKPTNKYAEITIDKCGRLWWVDEYTNHRIYMHNKRGWRKFSNGGTLRRLAEALCEYIVHDKKLNKFTFGPWPEHLCKGDLWGYGNDMQKVRNAAKTLELLEQ